MLPEKYHLHYSNQLRVKLNLGVVSYSKFEIVMELFRSVTFPLNFHTYCCLIFCTCFGTSPAASRLNVSVPFTTPTRPIDCNLLHHVNVCKTGNLLSWIHRTFFLFNFQPRKAWKVFGVAVFLYLVILKCERSHVASLSLIRCQIH